MNQTLFDEHVSNLYLHIFSHHDTMFCISKNNSYDATILILLFSLGGEGNEGDKKKPSTNSPVTDKFEKKINYI